MSPLIIIIRQHLLLPIDAFDVVVTVVDVEESTADDDDVIVEVINDDVSLGVIGPADCGPGVKPG